MIYDLIIIGGGAAGLFAGALLPGKVNGLILEKSAAPGKKLLMSGGGQCNLTHGGSIKDFVFHYGENGGRIRSLLYQANNLVMQEFFETRGISLMEREDGKVFPRSLRSKEVRDMLLACCLTNGVSLETNANVFEIAKTSSIYAIRCNEKKYQGKNLLIATGGCSYPQTGSDGKFFDLLKTMNLEVREPKPALVPIYVADYPYGALAGISFEEAKATIRGRDGRKKAERAEPLLLTHEGFSGPVILNLSRYAEPGDVLEISCCKGIREEALLRKLTERQPGNPRQLFTVLHECLNELHGEKGGTLPKRFLEELCHRAKEDPARKFASVSGKTLKTIVSSLIADRHSISRTGGFESAMVTSGGVVLDEVDLKTMECKKYPGMFFAGEVLDIDGDTGGYNLQFAFSSAKLAAAEIHGKNQV